MNTMIHADMLRKLIEQYESVKAEAGCPDLATWLANHLIEMNRVREAKLDLDRDRQAIEKDYKVAIEHWQEHLRDLQAVCKHWKTHSVTNGSGEAETRCTICGTLVVQSNG